MMQVVQLFQDFLEKNITVTIVIMAVLLVRMLLRKFPKKYSYLLWFFVGIRTLFDISVSSGISLFTLLHTMGNKLNGLFVGGHDEDAAGQWGRPLQEAVGKPSNADGMLKETVNEAAAVGNEFTLPIVHLLQPLVWHKMSIAVLSGMLLC